MAEHRRTVRWTDIVGLALPWSLTLGQPMLAILADGPTFLVAHHADRSTVLALALLLPFGIPVLLGVLAFGLRRRWPGVAMSILAGGLAMAVVVGVLQAAVRWRLTSTTIALVLALATAVAAALVTARIWWCRPAFRQALGWSTPIATVPALAFLLNPSLAGLRDDHSAAIGGGQAERPAPVVVVVLDELPLASLLDADEHVDASRFPAFARLAETADWYRNATTVAQSTAYAIPAILTGRYPDDTRLPTSADHPDNLFTLLGSAGFTLEVVEPHTSLCPAALCSGDTRAVSWRALGTDLAVVFAHLVVPPPLSDRLPTVGESWRGFATAGNLEDPAAAVASMGDGQRFLDPGQSLVDFVDGLAPARERSLDFLHVMLPHMPWRYLSSGKRYEGLRAPREPHGLRAQRWVGSPFEVAQAQQRHLLQLAFVDRQLGRLLDRLDAQDRFDEALVVVVADHGAAFRPGLVRRNVRTPILADIANIPLLIKRPGQRHGRIDDRAAETIDVLPTVADLLGLAMPPSIDGRSLLRPGPLRDERRLYRSGLAGRGPGRPYTFSTADFLPQRRQRIAERRRRFGDRPESLFALGDDRGWVGRPTSEIGVETGSPAADRDLRIHLDQRARLAVVDLGAESIPAHLTGTIDGDDPKPDRLVVTVGGVVRAVVEPYRDGETVRFSALVGEHALVDGANVVEIYGLDEGTKRRPFPIALAADDARTRP